MLFVCLSFSYLSNNIITLITHTTVGMAAPLFSAINTTDKSYAEIDSWKRKGFGCLLGCLKASVEFGVNAGTDFRNSLCYLRYNHLQSSAKTFSLWFLEKFQE